MAETSNRISSQTSSILLDSGTNELELLVFLVGGEYYGINVAKVRELIPLQENIVKIPNSPDYVRGSFKLRDTVLTLIDLANYLGVEHQYVASQGNKGLILIVEFSKITCGFLVDGVEQIHRLSWEDITPPSELLQKSDIPVTAMTKQNDRIIMLLDFERITGDIIGTTPEENIGKGIKKHTVSLQEYLHNRILVADDSATIRNAITNILKQAGFDNITVCADGQEAWERIQEQQQKGEDPFILIISDIEMPRMDGLHLTQKIKTTPHLENIPVILFSSLVTDDNKNKGDAVGADAQITKFDADELLQTISNILSAER